jgi:hypothetical protein
MGTTTTVSSLSNLEDAAAFPCDGDVTVSKKTGTRPMTDLRGSFGNIFYDQCDQGSML